jgi:SOS response regulatory protein OraA/RecX
MAKPPSPQSREQRDPLSVALRMLGRRPYSIAEMRRALERKFGAGQPVAAAIARLRELGLLGDKKFAEQHASSLARNRSFGRRRIERELKAKLVDYRHIGPALDHAFEETSEHMALEQALAKKLRRVRLPLNRSKLYALCQSLVRLGFRSDDIMKVVCSRPELRPAVDAEIVEPDTEALDERNGEL